MTSRRAKQEKPSALLRPLEVEPPPLREPRLAADFSRLVYINHLIGKTTLDACRNNPYEKRVRGLTRTTNERGAGLAAIQLFTEAALW